MVKYQIFTKPKTLSNQYQMNIFEPKYKKTPIKTIQNFLKPINLIKKMLDETCITFNQISPFLSQEPTNPKPLSIPWLPRTPTLELH